MVMECNDLIKQLEDLEIMKKRMEQILSPLGIRQGYSPLPEKENIEACQVAKFLCKLGKDNPRLRKNESPDFIVTFSDGLEIGIEHTRILTEFVKQTNSIKSLINKAECVFKEKYPEENKVFATIHFDNDDFSFIKTEQINLATEIADYVYSGLNGIKRERPRFLAEVILNRRHDRVGFVYGENQWKHVALDRDTLRESISLKEKNYQSTNKTKLYMNIGW